MALFHVPDLCHGLIERRYLKKTDTDEHLKSIIGDLNKQILNGN
jgi:hypothetical protein